MIFAEPQKVEAEILYNSHIRKSGSQQKARMKYNPPNRPDVQHTNQHMFASEGAVAKFIALFTNRQYQIMLQI